MKVIILRGISGAGKSTWIKEHAGPQTVVVSADHFFIQPDGTYTFVPEKLHDAHVDCFRKFLEAMEQRVPEIIVDNTNIHRWEFQPYVIAARAKGYDVELMTVSCDPEVAIQRKQWCSPGRVRKMANDLEREQRFFPKDIDQIHRVITT